MIDVILLEMRQQVALTNTVDDYKVLLEQATKKFEQFSEVEMDKSIQNPLAAILIEVYVKCPEAVMEYAKDHAVVSRICEKMFPHMFDGSDKQEKSS